MSSPIFMIDYWSVELISTKSLVSIIIFYSVDLAKVILKIWFSNWNNDKVINVYNHLVCIGYKELLNIL